MNQYEGAKCSRGHELEWVAEGFGLCSSHTGTWYAWSVTAPQGPFGLPDELLGRDGSRIMAWVSWPGDTRDEAMNSIEAEIAARNANPEAITLTPGPSYEEYLQAVGK